MMLQSQSKALESVAGPDAVLARWSEQLRALFAACRLPEQAEEAVELFARLLAATKEKKPGVVVPIGEGFSPLEFSLTSGAAPELAFVVEVGSHAALIAVLTELEPRCGLALDRLRAIEDLYFPETTRGGFAPRVCVSFARGQAAHFAVYLDPAVTGRAHGPLLIERALVRLGFLSGWPIIGQSLMRRGPDSDELKYVVLDLSSATPRFSVYARHMRSTVDDLEAAAAPCEGYRPDVRQFVSALGVESLEFDGLSPLTCYEFGKAPGARPSGVWTEFPICGYAPNEAVIEQRVKACLESQGLARDVYARALEAVLGGPARNGLGAQSHVALRRDPQGKPALTVRFPMNASGEAKVAGATAEPPLSGVMEVVERYEQWDQITNHPFLHRLRSEPVNLHHIWVVLANFQGSISKTFSQRLALIASRVNDPHIRYYVTKLLYDEMGSGDYKLAHVNLFADQMKLMEAYKPAICDEWTLGASRRFNEAMDRTYSSPDINVALGAIVSGEIFGRQFDQFLGDEIRRQKIVNPALFVWVTLHESLEVTHADEGAEIARLVPAEGIQAMARGAYRLACGAWDFLTDCYEICYCRRPGG